MKKVWETPELIILKQNEETGIEALASCRGSKVDVGVHHDACRTHGKKNCGHCYHTI